MYDARVLTGRIQSGIARALRIALDRMVTQQQTCARRDSTGELDNEYDQNHMQVLQKNKALKIKDRKHQHDENDEHRTEFQRTCNPEHTNLPKPRQAPWQRTIRQQ